MGLFKDFWLWTGSLLYSFRVKWPSLGVTVTFFGIGFYGFGGYIITLSSDRKLYLLQMIARFEITQKFHKENKTYIREKELIGSKVIQLSHDKDYAILGMDFERLKEILEKFAEHYEEDRIIFPTGPSRIGIAVHPDTEKMFRDKFHLTEENLNELIGDISFFIWALVRINEERIFRKYGKTNKVKKIVEIFKKMLQDRLIETLRFKYFCKTQYLEDLSWDVSVKVKQNGGTKMRLPFSMIKMSFSKPGFSLESILGEESAVTFECTLRDIEEMITSLKEIKIALEELQQKEGENE